MLSEYLNWSIFKEKYVEKDETNEILLNFVC